MSDALLAQLGGVAGATILLMQLFVKPFVLDKRWWPPIAIALSIALSLAVGATYKALTVVDVAQLIVEGVVAGAGAIGAYSGLKNALEDRP